jgi:IclR family transcriptional regulator, KDG regulon repressor
MSASGAGEGSQRESAGSQRGGAEPAGAPTRTLEKGLFLLGLFDRDHPEWSLRELRERAGLPKPTTRRLVKTLEAADWVAYDPKTGRYHLGSAVLKALYLATSHSELVRTIHPFLVSLMEETTETSILSVWTDQGPLILDTVPPPRTFKSLTFNGMLLEGVASADAMALIAFGPEENWDRILARPIQPRTEKTVTDAAALREKWSAIRREGVAFDWMEWNVDAPAVAVPLFDRRGHLRGALSIVVPIERASEQAMLKHAAVLKNAAAEIGEKLG